MVKIKVCGVTNEADALYAVDRGAWALGFIFYKKSPRYVAPAKAKRIIKQLPPFVTPVGVFVNEKGSVVKKVAEECGLQAIQLHGDESPAYCKRLKGFKIIKAFRMEPGEAKGESTLAKTRPYPVDAYLLDTFKAGTFGGTGQTFNWDVIKGKTFKKNIILSGGLNPYNVADAIKAVKPYAVDVSNGVEERPGKKSKKLLQQFFARIRSQK
ncbi:MAG: hypothetical protein A2Z88_01860 [Omnitrophica WOR_2 bacterium GWA2_47_8]|nr:MAG: hypothetical protein A2Z88_01860 [Omnitrophica WOR_2 bacterium GWA2_47_8]